MTRLRIFLHALDSDMVVAWRGAFADARDVFFVEGDILDDRCDAIVSPANSFGFMDGGIDLAYRHHFGMQLQSRVRAKIQNEFFGELTVGQATVVSTGQENVPNLVVAPTMRVPDRIGDTVNVYLAFRAALLAVLAHNRGNAKAIESLRVPAMGTGVGAMPLMRSARQMHAAYVSVFGSSTWLSDPAAILIQHEELRSA